MQPSSLPTANQSGCTPEASQVEKRAHVSFARAAERQRRSTYRNGDSHSIVKVESSQPTASHDDADAPGAQPDTARHVTPADARKLRSGSGWCVSLL
mmetsp:Transcript_22716/g.68295  ORF Transcript_22716/g.68295 Transcript_22716/m.68295 type:complete len:97 (+) Transcript_22716:454-744(+)